jgi:2-polyprenyl-6-methoxyphenol hydroxylase-like FAD-dependent oxidoreductase
MRGDRTLFLFTFADDGVDASVEHDTGAQKALLRKRFGASGWECPRILDALDATEELYFDRVSQIRMGSKSGAWARGRVVLVGDAASCVSLLAGQGSALSMAGAYVLAGELHKSAGEYATAFARYEDLFSPFLRAKQKAALRFAGSFAPKSKTGLFIRNQVMNLLAIPWIADLTFSRNLKDRLSLPEY